MRNRAPISLLSHQGETTVKINEEYRVKLSEVLPSDSNRDIYCRRNLIRISRG